MTFENAYNYLLSLSNLPRKEYMSDPKKCGWYLKRLQFFLDILGNPEKKIPHYIHVTGTSGKGSVTNFLHAILYAEDKRVGSTYSPHATCITERWKVGNKQMTKKEFAELIEYIQPKLDEYMRTTPYDMLSFFELIEAIGFLYFAKKKVEWAVLEVGCGGRYDSSNIIPHKDIAVITNIGLDHLGVIGNNKEEIAYEKAGIVKRGCRVFTSETDKKILDIIEKECEKQKTTLEIQNSKFQIQNKITNYSTQGGSALGGQSPITFTYKNQNYSLKTLGKHQITNAILCIDIATHLHISQSAIKKGLQNAHQPLRMEIVSQHPTIILDGAHNPDKIKTTVEATKQVLRCSGVQVLRCKNIHLIIGFSADKNISQMLKQLAQLHPKTIAITRQTINPFRKVADPQDMQKQLKKLLPKTQLEIFLDPKEAFVYTKKIASKNDLILVTGSIFLSGEIRGYLTK